MSARGARARVATPAPRPTPPRTRPRIVTHTPRRTRFAWWPVPIVALMLGGIVWINVSKLGLTTQTTAVVQQTRLVEEEKRLLNAELSQRNTEVSERARAELSMFDAPADDIRYLTAPKRPTLP